MKEEIVMLQEWQMPRACNVCNLGASVVYCYTDAMYLCSVCDSRAHAPSQGMEWHERVALCEACMQAPAAYTCEAEAVALCARCDMNIHSIDPIACQHSCTPILPIPRNYALPFSTGDLFAEETAPKDRQLDWPVITSQGTESRDYIEFLADHKLQEYHHLDLHAANDLGGLCQCSHLELLNLGEKHDKSDLHAQESLKLDEDSGFGVPKSDFTCSAHIIFPISEASVVSETNTAIKTTYLVKEEHPDGASACPSKQTKALSDRQARVLRYREKRKRRKFEKTIRYASRKAYADIRPRIKGRFAKSTDAKLRGDWLLRATISAELKYEYAYGFGYVPSY